MSDGSGSPAAPSRSGVVVVDKPAGATSHRVVGRLRRILGTRKIGHAGTLDPMATGVLVCGVNRATRLLGHLMLGTKTYGATIRLGSSTVTDDAEGDIIASVGAAGIGAEAVTALLPRFTGDIEQVPTQVSAIKIDGVRSYARARAGEQVELAARPVTVHRFDLVGSRRDGDQLDLDVEVECSSGTYIRALARDLGSALGCGGHLTALRRTRVGPYGIDRAEQVTDDTERVTVIDIAAVARENFPVLQVDADRAAAVSHGRALPAADLVAAGIAPIAVCHDDQFLALYRADGRPEAVFVG